MTSTPTVFAKGFRPFFLLAAAFAVAFLPLWLLAYTGHVDASAYWTPSTWHGHEMVFGFTVAVVAGFLLTAVGNWTKQETAVGGRLVVLCLLWLAGRLAVVFAGDLQPGLVVMADLLFIPALAGAIGRPLIRTNNRRNLKFLGILALLWGANAAMHLDALGVVEGWARPALLLAVDLIAVITLIIGGRIIPMFTRNAVGDALIRSNKKLEKFLVVAVGAAIALSVFAPMEWFTGAAAIIAGVAILARQTHWGAKQTIDKPILWVLHLGHAWIAAGFVLRGLAVFTPQVSGSMGTHALTVGAIGLLTLGMMARVALGHTGRELKVTKPVAWAFVAMSLAALGRTLVPIIWPSHYVDWVIASGVLFALAFAVYLLQYVPILVKPRADGRPG
ncbi:NnrS family protein [Persicimonas caeni]|uniref:NnrS family protein n=1 Tax=Persicimonas caeni TaxID=2292766 RepID=A0A4Y6PP99_PERCE|nr:NnrS family protein [Persicimonas caeni]QDG50171.1 NnrS family protein [Persicimonas caeni]QED31392.1 NnrS family protein [Persicimonas caeni]